MKEWGEGRSVPVVRETFHPDWRVEEKIPYRILGQFQSTYILCEGEEGLILIDQHAAHERILFETFKNKYETRSICLERFLIPILMELSAEESFLLASHLEEFQSIGFEIDPIGEKSYAIRSVPSILDQKDPKEIVREILDEFSFLKKEGKGIEPIQTILSHPGLPFCYKRKFSVEKRRNREIDRKPLSIQFVCHLPSWEAHLFRSFLGRD